MKGVQSGSETLHLSGGYPCGQTADMDSVANLTHRSMVYNAAFHALHYLPVGFHKRSRAVVREKPKRGLALLAGGIFRCVLH